MIILKAPLRGGGGAHGPGLRGADEGGVWHSNNNDNNNNNNNNDSDN